MAKDIEKPPLGVIPKKNWEETTPDANIVDYHKRSKDLADATVRYVKAGLEPKKEWLDEYNDIINGITPKL